MIRLTRTSLQCASTCKGEATSAGVETVCQSRTDRQLAILLSNRGKPRKTDQLQIFPRLFPIPPVEVDHGSVEVVEQEIRGVELVL